MPRILIKGYAKDEYYDETPCYYVDMDTVLAEKCLKRIGTVKGLREADDTVFSLHFWDHRGEWFDLYSLEKLVEADDSLRDEVDRVIEALEAEEIVVLDGSPLAEPFDNAMQDSTFDGGLYIRSECNLMEAMDDRVIWSGLVKHTSIQLETTSLRLDDLGKFANGVKVTPGKEK